MSLIVHLRAGSGIGKGCGPSSVASSKGRVCSLWQLSVFAAGDETRRKAKRLPACVFGALCT